MQANQIAGGYFLVFERGEEVIETLTQFCEAQEVHWATFQAVGAVEDVVIGYYDLPNRQYVWREEKGPFEVAAMMGNVAELDEGIIAHMHATLSACDESLSCIGGHIKSARVAVTLELSLWRVSQPLWRRFDEDTGLNLITLPL